MTPCELLRRTVAHPTIPQRAFVETLWRQATFNLLKGTLFQD